MNNIALTACPDYQYSHIAYFVESFCKYVTDCELVIVGARLSSNTLANLSERSVTFVDTDNRYIPVNPSNSECY